VDSGAKDISDPGQFSDPFIAWAREQLIAKAIEPKSSSTVGSGTYFGSCEAMSSTSPASRRTAPGTNLPAPASELMAPRPTPA
jgi:hypothetical protein